MSTISGFSNMREATMPNINTTAKSHSRSAAKSHAHAPESKHVSPQQKLGHMFQEIDTAGKGSITKVQFHQAFNKLNPPDAVKAMGADAAFAKIDSKGTGSVSKQDFIHGMQSILAQAKTSSTAAVQAKAAPTHAPTATPVASAAVPSAHIAAPMPVQGANGPIGNNINITA